MRLRPVLLALLALLALGGASVADAKSKHPKKGKPAVTKLKPVKGKLKTKIGIADQKSDVFGDPVFTSLGMRYARRSVGWDTMQYDWQIADVDAWLQAARAAGVQPLITFAKSRVAERRRYLPSVAEYRAAFVSFHKRWPWVKDYVASNESNHPAETTGRYPKRAVQYWKAMQSACRTCKVAAATLLDDKITLIKWTKQFLKYAKTQPRYWALHNYVSANKFNDGLTKQLLKLIKGEIWITEVGGLVHRSKMPGRIPLAEGVPHQTKVTRYIFDKLLRVSPRITRVYLYHWNSTGPGSSWDSGLIDASGKPRPSLSILEKVLGKLPKLPKAVPGKPTPVGPVDGQLPSSR
jgi:hypothetical protein